MHSVQHFQHLSDVKMTYMDHFRFSATICYDLGVASVKAFVHALLPCCYLTSTSDAVRDIQDMLDDAAGHKDGSYVCI